MELSLAGEGARFEGDQGLRRLRRLADLQVKRALEPIKGIAAVRVRGGLEEEYHILLDTEGLARTGISIQTVIDRLRQENINVAGGTLKEGRSEYMVRALNEYESLSEIGETVVVRIEGRDIRVKDLGRVVRSHREREILTRTQGSESVQIDIYKEADANIVSVARAVAEAVGKVRQPGEKPSRRWFRMGPPEDPRPRLAQRLHDRERATLRIVADRSGFIESSIREVRDAAIYGGLLAVAVLYLFLRDFKTTAIIGVSIPMSLLITFAPLHLMGVSLNIMSLGGLALGVGMLVDNSIVVLESIFRCRQEGDDLRAAAVRGTKEVRSAVVASTLTTVAVFLPMVFVEGIAGQTFGDLSLAVVTSLIASLLVAIYFIPMLASRQAPDLSTAVTGEGALLRPFRPLASWHAFREAWSGYRGRLARYLVAPWLALRLVAGTVLEILGRILLLLIVLLAGIVIRGIAPILAWIGRVCLSPPARVAGAFVDRVQARYPDWIRPWLARPLPVLLGMVASGWLTWELGRRLQTELLPEVHQGEFTVEVDLPVGTPLEETAAILTPVEQAILAHLDDIEAVLVTFGYDVTNIKRSDEGEHTARFKIVLRPSGNPTQTENRVLNRLRAEFAGLPDAEVRVVRPVLFSSQRPIIVEIQSDDLDELRDLSRAIEALLAHRPELLDVEASLRRGAPEIQVVYHRDRLALYGLNIGTIARQVRDMVKGFEATRFNLKDRRIPVVVRLDESDRSQVEDVGRLIVNPGAELPIALRAVADLTVGEGPSEIRRVDSQRVALVQANIGESSLGGAVALIRQVLRGEIQWPAGTDFAIRGQNEEWERSRGSLYLALALSLFLVYVIMAAQFESLVQPLIIMSSIPLAFFGTAVGLTLTGTAISVMVFLGLIVLAGIVVNNAIVLVDCANQLRARGHSISEAIALAGRIRLRPIILTTATTVLGLLPMALGLGEGAEIRTPLALTLIFGLISSTVLTLVIIPVLYRLTLTAQERLLKPAACGELAVK
jgi:HAE1 family hydrophobic/amphiphilic exporter-1